MFATLLLLDAHFGAFYLVPLDEHSKREFAGLLRWFWPWGDGDSGPLGVVTVSSGFPMCGFAIAVTSASLFLVAALALVHVWTPFH